MKHLALAFSLSLTLLLNLADAQNNASEAASAVRETVTN